MSGCFVRGFHGLQRCVLLLKYNLMYVLNSLWIEVSFIQDTLPTSWYAGITGLNLSIKFRGFIFQQPTSMHFSRMRTARLLPVSPRMHCAEKDLLRGGRKVCSGGSACRGDLLLGGSASGGVCFWGGLLWGVCSWGCIPACTEADAPPWTEWLTDRCKNLTFANFVCGR